jgi:hypothetical protein
VRKFDSIMAYNEVTVTTHNLCKESQEYQPAEKKSTNKIVHMMPHGKNSPKQDHDFQTSGF